MKKLLVLTLAVVLTLSLTVVASAATFDPYIGGRITWAYIDSDSTKDDPVTLNNSGIKLLLQGKIQDEDTGTWATIGAKIDGWPNDGALNGPNAIYDFGINNVGGSNLSIWYTNWENQNMKRGQGRVYDLGLQYHEDPMFDHAPGNIIGFDYNTDNFVLNFGYVLDKKTFKNLKASVQEDLKEIDEDDGLSDYEKKIFKDELLTNLGDDAYDTGTYDKNEMLVAATFKFDGGDVHVGYWTSPEETTESAIGFEYKLGFGTIKADYVAKEDKAGTVDGNIIQAAVFFDELKFDVTLVSDSDYKYANGGTGYQIRYTGLADGKIVIGYKAMEADKDADAAKAFKAGDFGSGNFETAYIGYKYGIFESRLGFGSHNDGGKNEEDFTYVSIYASLW